MRKVKFLVSQVVRSWCRKDKFMISQVVKLMRNRQDYDYSGCEKVVEKNFFINQVVSKKFPFCGQ